jgi:hypothetical protein
MDGFVEGADVTGEAVTSTVVAIDGETEGKLDGFVVGIVDGVEATSVAVTGDKEG